MAITPSTNLKLLKCPITLDNKNQLTFASKQAQYNYFNNLPCTDIIQDSYYQRKDSYIEYPAHIDDIIEFNYCMYQNENYTDKWFYCYITNMEYINDGTTRIYITTDVFQTWQFDLIFKSCFVEREHVNDDVIGNHTVDEGFNIGEPVVNSHLRDSYNRGTQRIIVCANIEPSDGNKVYAGVYQGVASGYKYFSYPMTSEGLEDVMNHILLCENRAGDINQLFMAPEWLAGDTVFIPNSGSPATQDLGISRISSLDGYTPKNKKLLTSPFCFILLSNGQGQEAVLKQERWALDDNNEMVARMEGCLTAGCSIRLTPINYNGDDHSNMYGINLGKFPQLSWSTDPYINWLTENGTNVVTQIISTGSKSSGDVVGMGLQALNIGHEIDVASNLPPQVKGNTNAGDVMWASRENCFHVYRMTIKSEIARIIDEYFSKYGYKINRNKVPNITGRPNWNFVKTQNANIIGNIPQQDLQTIKQIFDNGVTLWHNSGTFLDYSQNNN